MNHVFHYISFVTFARSMSFFRKHLKDTIFRFYQSLWFIVYCIYMLSGVSVALFVYLSMLILPHVVGAQLYRLSTVNAHTDVLKPIHGKIIWHYSRYCAVTFCYEHKCELSYIHPGHDVKLRPHRVKLYRIGCVGSGLALAKALT